jgi:hypothetical protein
MTSGAAPTKSPELDKAMAALRQEYAGHLKNPGGAALRSSCDYFAKGTSVPLEPLLLSLEKPVAGVAASDARQTAYVKWQLLSGLPETLDDATARRLLKVYERAPVPAPRFGSSSQEKKKLDGLLSGARAQDDVRLNATLDEAVARAKKTDAPIIAFRDELYRRLPRGRDKFVAAILDAHARIHVAADKEKLAEALAKDVPAWALTAGTDRAQVREVADLLGKLRFVESPPYYAYASVRSGKLAWRTRTDTLLTPKKFADLHKQVLDAAGVGPLPDSPKNGSTRKTGTTGTTP